MGIYKPLNYDATMLIRLTTEMKDAFLLVVRLVALCQAKKLDAESDYVLNQWGVDPNPKTSATIALERCEDTLDMFPGVPAHPSNKTTSAPTTTTTIAKKKEKRRVLFRYTMGKLNACLFFCLSVYYEDIHKPKKAILPW